MDSIFEGYKGCENKLLQAHTLIWNHHLSFIKSMSLKTAVQLEIPDIIHNHNHGGGGPMSISQLASALSIPPTKISYLHHLMRFLVHSGFFSEQKTTLLLQCQEIGYVLTDPCRFLLKDNPLNQRLVVLAMGESMIKSWDHASEWLKNNDKDKESSSSAFAMAYGKPLWEFYQDKPELNEGFNEMMAADILLSTNMVIRKCRRVFEGLDSIVDVGGGTGCMAKAIAQEFPHMDCVVLDLPHVVSALKGGKNLKFVAGNMFHEIPHTDAILLKWILHDWSDENCLKILERCKEAVAKKVIIIDMVLENSKEKGQSSSINNETQLLCDMLMMVQVAGKERNEEEWAKLFTDAGFSSYNIISHELGLRSLIELYP